MITHDFRHVFALKHPYTFGKWRIGMILERIPDWLIALTGLAVGVFLSVLVRLLW